MAQIRLESHICGQSEECMWGCPHRKERAQLAAEVATGQRARACLDRVDHLRTRSARDLIEEFRILNPRAGITVTEIIRMVQESQKPVAEKGTIANGRLINPKNWPRCGRRRI